MYHYTDSGLDNVFLENGYIKHETPYGDGVSIENLDGLHKAICLWLIEIPKVLDGAELRFIRLEMELTQRDLAGILGETEQNIGRWERSEAKKINGCADRLVRALLKEYLVGDASVRAMVDRMALLNVVEEISANFCETPAGWINHGCAA